eukprot:SAG22_NODE_750_length_7481_cov_19.618667_6_plen_102_part_00
MRFRCHRDELRQRVEKEAALQKQGALVASHAAAAAREREELEALKVEAVRMAEMNVSLKRQLDDARATERNSPRRGPAAQAQAEVSCKALPFCRASARVLV